MKLYFEIEYQTCWGDEIYVYGSLPELGQMCPSKAFLLKSLEGRFWSNCIDIEIDHFTTITYKYCVKKDGKLLRIEEGLEHSISIFPQNHIHLCDFWKEAIPYNFFLTSPFQDISTTPTLDKPIFPDTIILQVICPYIFYNQLVVLCGSSFFLGEWEPSKGQKLKRISQDTWQLAIPKQEFKHSTHFKFTIYDAAQKKVIQWEAGENRVGFEVETGGVIKSYNFVLSQVWKAAGVAIPVFSLRSQESFGIGDFADIRKMIDWVSKTGQKILQVLPVNDTTTSGSWRDSYPYNAISVFALHPIYLGLRDFPLDNKTLHEKFISKGRSLNDLPQLDYEAVLKLKNEYIDELFKQEGEEILNSNSFLDFYTENKYWLFPYACFCYLRDLNNTTDFSQWQTHDSFDEQEFSQLFEEDQDLRKSMKRNFLIQFLLDRQLRRAKKYANLSGVILKGDIPIGISRNSVDSWISPHLFNMDKQTGAPPDNFAKDGQNWGFPTYNWSQMSADSYSWWKQRFQKMSDYFDAYRIDHILGFFRIWEIPLSSKQGLLGQFSPALPLSKEEIMEFGLELDVEYFSSPLIYSDHLQAVCPIHFKKIISNYLSLSDAGTFRLHHNLNNQQKIETHFQRGTQSNITLEIKNILLHFCNEVLFVKDSTDPNKYHPRISVQDTLVYQKLSTPQKQAMDNLYNHFFYHRHNQFWRNEALKKLPPLISSTQMLVCGEDLGMIPSCVPDVMAQLQILSLEIERMPKMLGSQFSDLSNLPYLSVCSTSTHDMSPIRLWWQENPDIIQYYYNVVLKQIGEAPANCTKQVSLKIIENHLQSSSMLVVIPLQDWMAISSELRSDNIHNDRINIPADPNHYWRYRMHIKIEDLLEQTPVNTQIRQLIRNSER